MSTATKNGSETVNRLPVDAPKAFDKKAFIAAGTVKSAKVTVPLKDQGLRFVLKGDLATASKAGLLALCKSQDVVSVTVTTTVAINGVEIAKNLSMTHDAESAHDAIDLLFPNDPAK